MGGLEAVDLRDGAGDNDRHGIGHVVELQGVGDVLLEHLRPQPLHPIGRRLVGGFLFFTWHSESFQCGMMDVGAAEIRGRGSTPPLREIRWRGRRGGLDGRP